MAKGAVPDGPFSLFTSCSKSVSCATHIGPIPVKNRQTGWPRWNMGLSAEDIPEVRVQGVEPDLF